MPKIERLVKMNSIFNNDSRTKNAIKCSFVSTVSGIISLLANFGYRTCFIHFFTAEYLGVEGLFTNILHILSLAELGVGTAIVYRFYEPICCNDINKVGRLIKYFKKIYLVIGMVIMGLGLCVMAVLPHLINASSAITEKVNLRFVFFLFLVQTASTYLYSYKQTLLIADQKQYLVSIYQCVIKIMQYSLQISVLAVTKNYVFTLISGILLSVFINYLISLWITRKYKPVFEVDGSIDVIEKREIFSNTKNVMCHKVGGTILSSTDNIVLSKYVSLYATGLYSNYSMIIAGISSLLGKAFGSFTASFGNAHVQMLGEEKRDVYLKLNFANLLFSGLTTVCLWILLNDFVLLWVGKEYQFDRFTVAIICTQYYMESSRIVSTSFTIGAGLFQKDVLRPFIEAIINVAVSIFLVSKMGIAGVFAGTIFSHLVTVFWREPYILFKYEFNESTHKYWVQYCKTTMVSLFSAYLLQIIFTTVLINMNWGIWVLKGILSALIYLITVSFLFRKNNEFIFWYELMVNMAKRIFR